MSAVSEVDICNRALDGLGADPIASLDDAAVNARRCKRQYPLARDACLRGYEWNCAMARAILPAEATGAAWGGLKAFNLPAGGAQPYCLRVVEIEGERDYGLKYKVERRQIVTDEPGPLNILYIAQVTDTAQFDALLADAIAARLRADLAYAITGSAALSREAAEEFRRILAEARRVDAREGTAEEVVADEWLLSRL